MKKAAAFSEDRAQRYLLTRNWQPAALPFAKTVNFIMLNPSTADEDFDDATIRKCIGFARRWGYNELHVTNLIPIISTDPAALPPWSGFDQLNLTIVNQTIAISDLVVGAWGSYPGWLSKKIALVEYRLYLRDTLRKHNSTLHCIGTTAKGEPRHPSRAPYTSIPIRWYWPEER